MGDTIPAPAGMFTKGAGFIDFQAGQRTQGRCRHSQAQLWPMDYPSLPDGERVEPRKELLMPDLTCCLDAAPEDAACMHGAACHLLGLLNTGPVEGDTPAGTQQGGEALFNVSKIGG